MALSEKAEGKHPYDIQELCFNFVRDDYAPSDNEFVAVVARAVVGSPHGAPQEQIHHPRESQLIQLFKRGRRITDSSDS